MMINPWILPFSLIGLMVSWYIFHKKHHKKEKMVCYVSTNCDKVVHSQYSRILGIHLEVLGVIYYLVLSLFAVANYFGVLFFFGFTTFDIVLILSTAAFVFSLFLIYVQIFVIHDWCEYCLVSAVMSVSIFVIEILPIFS